MAADRRIRWIRLTPRARRELLVSDPPEWLRRMSEQVKAHVPFDPEAETGVLVWVPRRKVS